MSTTAVNGTVTFQSSGDSPVILREVAEMVEGFQRLKLPVAVTITVMLDGEMAAAPTVKAPAPAIKEAPAATANFPAPVPEMDGADEVDGVDWGVTGLTEDAKEAVTALENEETAWRRIRKDIRLELIQAVLAQPTESGKAMTMSEFDRIRPTWMAQAVAGPTTFGCSWPELRTLRLSE